MVRIQVDHTLYPLPVFGLIVEGKFALLNPSLCSWFLLAFVTSCWKESSFDIWLVAVGHCLGEGYPWEVCLHTWLRMGN